MKVIWVQECQRFLLLFTSLNLAENSLKQQQRDLPRCCSLATQAHRPGKIPLLQVICKNCKSHDMASHSGLKNEKCESKMILWNNEFPPIICIFELPTTIVMGQVQKRQAIPMPSFECRTLPGPSFKPLSRAQTLMIFMFLLNM